jgi:O-antigen biosynthesis protein
VLITCLCVTTQSRRAWFANALLCFERQTYVPRELVVIVDDDRDGFLIDIAMRHDLKVRIVVDRTSKTIGHKRNIGCQFASGEVIAHWDDDDHSSSGRLDHQIETLKRTGKAVTAYNKMKFTDGLTWWLYDGILQSTGIGTSLCYRKQFWTLHPFQPIQVAEDNAFISEARRCGQYVTGSACGPSAVAGIEDTDLMYATIHAGNTSPRDVRNYLKLQA